MHSTPDARLAIVSLLLLAAFVALARRGDAAYAARTAQLTASVDAGHGREPGDRPGRGRAPGAEAVALRDGAAMDVNRASAAELELLPGVGPRLAAEIVRVRERAGPFRAPEALRSVRGIGPKKLAKLRPFLRFSEGLEHPAQAQRDVGAVHHFAPLDRDAGADVESDGEVARDQVVGAEHDVAAGTQQRRVGAIVGEQ